MLQDSPDYELRSRGIAFTARRRLTRGDVRWADRIFVMDKHQRNRLIREFGHTRIAPKTHVLNIDDRYVFMEDDLIRELAEKLEAAGLLVPERYLPTESSQAA